MMLSISLADGLHPSKLSSPLQIIFTHPFSAVNNHHAMLSFLAAGDNKKNFPDLIGEENRSTRPEDKTKQNKVKGV